MPLLFSLILDDHGNLNDHGNPKLNLILGNNYFEQVFLDIKNAGGRNILQ